MNNQNVLRVPVTMRSRLRLAIAMQKASCGTVHTGLLTESSPLFPYHARNRLLGAQSRGLWSKISHQAPLYGMCDRNPVKKPLVMNVGRVLVVVVLAASLRVAVSSRLLVGRELANVDIDRERPSS